ncbi:LOW QUALITY PROTEIN: hypothetical protein QYF61_025652 [Mycteria americana]|uniref:Uncharacterized protein n=1 Tax=Mycteria americana TaxID=33587 RepID=A0AAN7NXB8_MYCAM|nr:LOW QUALITY PROTEIN: hypothetical protein QYF61_025652 [Mycteria americana]
MVKKLAGLLGLEGVVNGLYSTWRPQVEYHGSLSWDLSHLMYSSMGSSSAEKDLGVLVGNELNMNQQRALVAKSIISRSGVTTPLYSALFRPHIILHPVLGPQYRKYMN